MQKIKLAYRNLLHFYMLVTKLWQREIKKIIPLTIASKRIKYIGINLTKEVKNLYSEKYKTLIKETEEDTNKWNILLAHKLEKLILLYAHTTQINLQIQCNSYQNTNGIFYRAKIILQHVWKYKRSWILKQPWKRRT